MQAASSTAQGGVRRGWVRRRQGSGARGRGQAPRASRGDALWRAFEEKVKGEWVGRLAEFEGSTGAPVPIDKIYLPEAYVEWAANLYDWQTHTITETGRETPGKVSGSGIDHKLRVLVPQDSCECFDLEVMESEHMMLKTDPENEGEDKTVLADGSYSAGTRKLSSSDPMTTMVFETCFVKTENERVRVRQHVSYSTVRGQYVLAKTEVVSESRLPPSSQSLSVSGLPSSIVKDPLDRVTQDASNAFAEKERTDLSLVGGDWGDFVGEEYRLDLDDSPQGGSFRIRERPGAPLEPVGANAAALPLGLWSRVDTGGSGPAGVVVEVGMVAEGRRRLLQREYDVQTGFLTRLLIGYQCRGECRE